MIREANLHWRCEDTECNLIMPWYTKGALDWVKTNVTKEWNVFEYGSGYSSIWWRLHCKWLFSVDHNKDWADAMRTIHIDDKEKYIEAIKTIPPDQMTFHCIIVDGEWRGECVEYAIDYLKPGGALIIDNYEQPTVGYDFTRTNELLKNWERTIYHQFNHADWKTAIFIKPL